jgi:hypothetical protein
MPKHTDNRLRILRALHVLRLGDLETLVALLKQGTVGRNSIGHHGIEKHLYRLVRAGVLRRLFLPDDSRNPYRAPAKRAVFLLGTPAYPELGIKADEARALDRRYDAFVAHGSRLQHELMIAIIHASLLKAQRDGRGKLQEWVQGEGAGEGLKIKPDARMHWNGAWFYIEVQNRKRIRTDTVGNRSTEKQIRNYSMLDKDDLFPVKDPRVLFVTRERHDPPYAMETEVTLLDIFKSQGFLKHHHKRFFQVASLTFFKEALKDSSVFLRPFIQTGLGETLPISTERARFDGESARPPLPLLEDAPTHERDVV